MASGNTSAAFGPTDGVAATTYVGEGPNSAITGIHVAYGLLVVAWVAVLMKLSIKIFFEKRKWKMHDYFAMLGLIFATAAVIVIAIDVNDYGEGQHMSTVPEQNYDMVFRLIDHFYIMYEMALMFIKLSILSFYLALFDVKPRFRYSAYFMMAFVVLYLAIFVLIDTFRCTPVKKMWYPATTKGHCLDGVLEQRAFGIFNSVTDVIILLMPFPVLLRLQMTKSKMLSLGLIFGIGAFTCGAAIARTIIIWDTLASHDSTWSVGPEITWMNVEMLVGLICGSLLSSPALFRHILRETTVGQSLISLLSRHSSRGSQESLPGRYGAPSMRKASHTDSEQMPGSSIYGARSADGSAFCSSSSTGKDKVPKSEALGHNIGVENTVEVSVHTP